MRTFESYSFSSRNFLNLPCEIHHLVLCKSLGGLVELKMLATTKTFLNPGAETIDVKIRLPQELKNVFMKKEKR